MSVRDCRLIQLPKITDRRGNLSFLEGGVHVPFSIARAYYLYDVPEGESRGGHAHKKLEQFFLAMSGAFDIEIDDGRERRKFHLEQRDVGLYVPSMMWRELASFAANTVCLVLASERYEEADYFREYSAFAAAARAT